MAHQRWRKVLYERQDFPDNFVAASFLDEMKKNVNTKTYKLSDVIFESGVVSQQLSSVILFVAAFVYMDIKAVTPDTILMIALLLSFLGYLFCKVIDSSNKNKRSSRKVRDDVKSVIILSTLVTGLSPILWTLTDTVSTDTIYAMTTFMLAANLLFHDYGAGSAIVSKAVSLNASIFAAICLGSRLPSAWHVTIYVILAMQIFGLLPFLRMRIKEEFPWMYVIVTLVSIVLTIGLLIPWSKLSAIGLFIGYLCITIFFPLWMIMLQHHKNNIHGPWDEAMIKR